MIGALWPYSSPPPGYVQDGRGKLWPRTGLVGRDCEWHDCWDPMTGASWPTRETPPPPPPVKRTAGALRGIRLGNDVVTPAPAGFDAMCSLPTLSGLIMLSAIGVFFSRGRAIAGAMNGAFGGWLGCAAARAIGAGDVVSVALTFGGAALSAKTFR